jgi:hypothetical protein
MQTQKMLDLGPTLMIFEIVSQKSLAKNGVFAQTTASFCKKLDQSIGFEKNANFFAGNRLKSQKLVMITSTLGPQATATSSARTS